MLNEIGQTHSNMAHFLSCTEPRLQKKSGKILFGKRNGTSGRQG
jgi:hypothetical protein